MANRDPVLFNVPEHYTQHPRVLDRVKALLDVVDGLADTARQRLRWQEGLNDIEKDFNDLVRGEAEPELQPTRATARILLYFQNKTSRQEAVEIDGVRFGLIRNPNRLNADRVALDGFANNKYASNLIPKDTPEFNDFLALLHRSDADNIVNQIWNMHSKLTHIKIDTVEGNAAEGAHGDLGSQDMHGAGLVSHPHVTARVSVLDGQLCFSGKHAPTSGDCIRRAVLQCFGSPTFQRRALDLSDVPSVTKINDPRLLAWFRKNRLGFTAYDRKGNVLHCEKAGERNANIRPSHMYLLLHNNHATLLNRDLDSLAHKGQTTDSAVKPPGKHYPSKPVQARQNRFVESFDELIALFASTQDQEGETYFVHYNSDIEALFFRLKDCYSLEPEVRVNGSAITAVVLRLQNTYHINDFPINNPEEGRMPIERSQYDTWLAWMQNFGSCLLAASLKSRYSANLLAVFQALPKAQLHRRLRADAPAFAMTIDVVRAYTRNLMDVDKIPVFVQTDDFRAYDPAQPIDKHSFYLIENITSSPEECLAAWFIANRRWNLISGRVLSAVLDRVRDAVRVHSLISPSHLAENPAAGLVEQLYDSPLSDTLKKFTVNSIIGLCNKKYTQNHSAVYTTDPVEAVHFAGDAKKVTTLRAGHMLATQSSERVALEDGFLPLGFLVYDLMRLRMLQAYDQVTAAGATVYAIATDCLYVDQVPEGLSLTTTKTVADFGRLHGEGLKRVPLTMWLVDENENPVQVLPKRRHDRVDALVPGTLVTGILPGSGKTHLLATQLPLEDTLWLTATNEQQQRLEKCYPGLQAMTLCKFLNLRVGNDGLQPCGRATLTDAHNVVIDEVFQQSIVALGHLRAFMQACAGEACHWYATGDLHQTGAAEALNAIHDRSAYMDILADMLPNEYRLETCWRVPPEQVPRLHALREALFVHGQSPLDVLDAFPFKTVTRLDGDALPFKKALALSNMTAQIVNGKLSDEKLPQFEVLCKAYHRDLVMNKSYTVVGVQGSYYQLSNGKSYCKSWFRSPHCLTGHSVQGSTIDEPYAIFDVCSPHASQEWFWVCVTRASNLDNVYIYKGPRLGSKLSVSSKLKSYAAHDASRGLQFDLTSQWVMTTMKKQNYCCALCHDLLDLEAPTDDPFAWSADRMDNLRGHSQDNCVITHVHCNKRSH